MSNVLSEEEKQQVIALGRLGWSLRKIQKATGVHRTTAADYLRAAGIALRPPGAWGKAAPAKPPNEVTPDSGSAEPPVEPSADSPSAKPANGVTPDFGVGLAASPVAAAKALPPVSNSSASACEPHREAIELGLSRGRNAKAIWQDLVDIHGFASGYQSVKRFVRQLRGTPSAEACAVIETAPGEECQVDYGSGPLVRDADSGKYRRTRLFVLTLGNSRKAVRLLTFRSSSQVWAELHEKAFRRLGGATRVVVLDNLREGVLKPDIYDPTLNPLYRDVLAHYGAVALACRVRDPDRKAYVSYCTSSRPCNGEDGLLGPAASMALENRALIQRFVQATAGVVVTMLLQSALSSPKIDCSGGHSVAHAHLFGGEQSLGP
jgi:transposase